MDGTVLEVTSFGWGRSGSDYVIQIREVKSTRNLAARNLLVT